MVRKRPILSILNLTQLLRCHSLPHRFSTKILLSFRDPPSILFLATRLCKTLDVPPHSMGRSPQMAKVSLPEASSMLKTERYVRYPLLAGALRPQPVTMPLPEEARTEKFIFGRTCQTPECSCDPAFAIHLLQLLSPFLRTIPNLLWPHRFIPKADGLRTKEMLPKFGMGHS